MPRWRGRPRGALGGPFREAGRVSPNADDLVGEFVAFASASAVVGWIPALLELRKSGLVVRVGGTKI